MLFPTLKSHQYTYHMLCNPYIQHSFNHHLQCSFMLMLQASVTSQPVHSQPSCWITKGWREWKGESVLRLNGSFLFLFLLTYTHAQALCWVVLCLRKARRLFLRLNKNNCSIKTKEKVYLEKNNFLQIFGEKLIDWLKKGTKETQATQFCSWDQDATFKRK